MLHQCILKIITCAIYRLKSIWMQCAISVLVYLLLHLGRPSVLALRSNFLQFDDCYIGQSKTLSLQMTNHLPMDSFRFMWPDHLYLKFSPQVGHLHPCASKNILVTFKSTSAVRFRREPVSCFVKKIIYSKPLSEVPDWDDRIKVVKWVDVTSPVPARER